jgi:hypothetical protein
MLLALYPLARGCLSLTIFFLLSIDGCFVKGVSNNFLVLLDITCTSRYYFLVLVDITCALCMTTHMIKWVRVRMLLPGFMLWTGEVHVEYMVRGEADFRASYKHSLNYPFLTRNCHNGCLFVV